MSNRLLTNLVGAGLVTAALIGGMIWYRDSVSTTSSAPAAGVAADPAPAQPDDFRSDLRSLSPIAAAALLHIEERILTAFDSASAATSVPCDEGMPDHVIFAADANVLDVTHESQWERVKVELTSVAQADITTEGCDVIDVATDQRIRTDTVDLFMAGGSGWRPYFEEVMLDDHHTPLVGRIDLDTTVNWETLLARVDSIRRARNKPLIRPPVPTGGHYAPLVDLASPGGSAVNCPAPSGGAAPGSLGEIAYDDGWHPGMFDRSGAWFAIWQPRATGERNCIAAVTVTGSQRDEQTCYFDPNKRPVSWYLNVDSIEGQLPLPNPLLLVRDILGLRTGLQATRFSTISVPGWDRGALIYDDTHELFRIVETPGEPRAPVGFRLSVVTPGNRQSLLFMADEKVEQSWSVFWVGHLNGDDVPDMILRVSKHREGFQEHGLRLVLSTTDPPVPSWRLGPETTVLECK